MFYTTKHTRRMWNVRAMVPLIGWISFMDISALCIEMTPLTTRKCCRCLTRTSRNVINIFEWYVGIHFTSSHIASLSHLHFNFLLWYSWAAKCIASHDISIFSPGISWTVRVFFLSNSTFRCDHKNDKHIQRFYYWLKMNSPRTFISHRLDVSVYRLTKFWQKIYDSDVHHIW